MAAQSYAPEPRITSPLPERRFPKYGYAGFAVILIAEVCLLANVSLVATYFTPLVWTGYILIIDSVLLRNGVREKPFWRSREIAVMAPWSIVCWLIFELYNLRLENWTYVGLPENTAARYAGYAWSFATIFPAILLTAELIKSKLVPPPLQTSFPVTSKTEAFLLLTGAIILAIPLIVSRETSSRLFALVWVGFILVLDPINFRKERRSILCEVARGNLRTLLSLLLSGLWCGFLWEFWNYWAGAKWVYNVPISFAGPKIFEMPLLGFLGFPPFAVECFVMNEFLYAIIPSLSPRITSAS